MIPKDPEFPPRPTSGGPALQRRQPVLDPVYSQDRILRPRGRRWPQTSSNHPGAAAFS
jgi:hypothetical protein